VVALRGHEQGTRDRNRNRHGSSRGRCHAVDHGSHAVLWHVVYQGREARE